jgi:hypothetical protein
MRNQNVHRIQKHAITLAFQNEAEATSWNRYASEFHHNQILPALNALFDEMAPAGKMISIDKLEIDLGRIALPDLMPFLVMVLKEKLAAAMPSDEDGTRQGFSGSGPGQIHPLPHFLKQNKAENSSDNPSNAVQHEDLKIPDSDLQSVSREVEIVKNRLVNNDSRTVSQDPFRARLISSFTHFLKYGVLPWNSPARSITELERQLTLLFSQGFEREKPGLYQVLSHKNARQRLHQQFSFAFENKLLHELFAVEFRELTRIHEQASDLVLHINKDQKQTKFLHGNLLKTTPGAWLSQFASSDPNSWPEEFSFFLFEKTFPKNRIVPAPVQALALEWVKIKNKDSYGAFLDSLISKYLVQEGAPRNKRATKISAKTDSKENAQIDPDLAFHAPKHRGASGESSIVPPNPQQALELLNSAVRPDLSGQQNDQENELSEHYYLSYAGVILTWAYLPVLFDKLGYLHGNQFRTKKAEQRAVHLLGYIANGRTRNDEPDLLIAKILCGLVPTAITSGRIRLKEIEKEEANVMLKSLIANWSILKNTSVEGLQSSFFARDGKLMRQANRWKLIVEQKSYDMVLDHLPYPVSLIKLPWMEEILTVDWM